MPDVSRFIYVPDFVVGGIVDKEAFLPDPKKRPYETSVSVHVGCGIDWCRGVNIGAGRKKPQPLVGSAELDSATVDMAGLCLDVNGAGPYPKHANIKGWDEIDEFARYGAADILAQNSVFVQPPIPPSPAKTLPRIVYVSPIPHHAVPKQICDSSTCVSAVSQVRENPDSGTGQHDD